jgi:hypothetical protein
VPPGICKLCLKDSNLQKSHLIPAAVYKICRTPDGKGDPSPLMITMKNVRRTSRQATAHILCRSCEQLLSREGEDWVIPRLANKKGFILAEMLKSSGVRGMMGSGELIYLATGVPGLDVQKLIHFAMGIFWKASVHEWGFIHMTSRVKLGKYGELARRFVLGEIPFPDEMKLLAIASPWPLTITSIKLPMEGRRWDCRTFNFIVPGLSFILCVGRQIPSKLRQLCVCTGPGHPIMEKDLAVKVRQWTQMAWKEARIAKNVLEGLDLSNSGIWNGKDD